MSHSSVLKSLIRYVETPILAPGEYVIVEGVELDLAFGCLL
jgi:hypothetical protein